MHFVTLTSDWNKDDYYTGAVKGSLLSSCEQVEIVTLSKQIRPYNISEAAFVLRNCFPHYPKGTIHIVAVSSKISPESKFLAAKIDGQYILTGDNGLMGLLGDAEPEEIIFLNQLEEKGPKTFPALTLFCEIACKLIQGESLKELGVPAKDYIKQIPLRATLENNTITGTVIYLDSYGNAITNISRDLFERIGKEREFEIFVQSKHYKISKLNTHYSETTAGDLLALFNSVNLLEVAIRNGSAKELLNLNTDSTIRVEYKGK
jgi:S-adenosylmethionine hydrolase